MRNPELSERAVLGLVCLAFTAGAAWGAVVASDSGWHRLDTVISIMAPLLVWSAWTSARQRARLAPPDSPEPSTKSPAA